MKGLYVSVLVLGIYVDNYCVASQDAVVTNSCLSTSISRHPTSEYEAFSG